MYFPHKYISSQSSHIASAEDPHIVHGHSIEPLRVSILERGSLPIAVGEGGVLVAREVATISIANNVTAIIIRVSTELIPYPDPVNWELVSPD